MGYKGLKKFLKKMGHDDTVAAMRDGRVIRSVTFKPGKGAGSYSRKQKHRAEPDA